MEYDKLKNWNQFLMNDNFTNVNIKIGDIYTMNKIYSYVEKIHKVEEDFYDGDIGERIARFSKYVVSNIPIDKINMSEYYIDLDIIKNYIKIYKKLETYPPIILGYYDNKWGYDIIDGTHRSNALKKLGINNIISFVGLNYYQKQVY